MNRKVIYVCFGRLTDKMARDWYIDYLIEKGVTVEYWDVVSLLREEHSERGAQNPGYLHVFRSSPKWRRAAPTGKSRCDLRNVDHLRGPVHADFSAVFQIRLPHADFAWGALPHDPVYKWRKVAAWLSTPT